MSSVVQKNFFESFKKVGISRGIRSKIYQFYILFQCVMIYIKSSDVANYLDTLREKASIIKKGTPRPCLKIQFQTGLLSYPA